MLHFRYYYCLLVFTITVLCVQYSQAQADPNTRDLVVLTKWFEGEFDNDSQIWFEGRRGWTGSEEEKHDRIHANHHKIELPSIGDHVFYVEEFLNNDLANISRQRVVSFESDIEAGGIRMIIYFLKNAPKVIIGKDSLHLLSDIDPDGLFTLNECDVIFKRLGEQYHGSMVPKACQFGDGNLKRYSVHDMIISRNQYWRVDRTFLVSNDKFHKGHPTEVPHKMRRATYYDCDVSFYETAYYAPSEKDQKYHDIPIHNQGGMEWFMHDASGKKYGVQLREKEYPYYPKGSDFFMLRFIEEGALASTVIITATPGQEKISFQIGWASVACRLQNANN